MNNVDLLPKKATYIGWPILPRSVALCAAWGVVYVFAMSGIAKYQKVITIMNSTDYLYHTACYMLCVFFRWRCIAFVLLQWVSQFSFWYVL